MQSSPTLVTYESLTRKRALLALGAFSWNRKPSWMPEQRCFQTCIQSTAAILMQAAFQVSCQVRQSMVDGSPNWLSSSPPITAVRSAASALLLPPPKLNGYDDDGCAVDFTPVRS